MRLQMAVVMYMCTGKRDLKREVLGAGFLGSSAITSSTMEPVSVMSTPAAVAATAAASCSVKQPGSR